MRVCIATLKSASPYSQSRVLRVPKKPKERPDEYEERVWRERCHTDDEGNIVIPPMVFKNCLDEAAKFLSIKIPGKGNATFTKHFEAGVMVMDALPLPDKKDTVQGEWLFLHSNGVRGSGKRVWKCYPMIPSWEGDVTFYVMDETVSTEVFEEHLEQAGKFIGIGRFRPRNRGYYGRFGVVKTRWEE